MKIHGKIEFCVPGALVAATPSLLLCVDVSKTPRDVYWLDLSGKVPTPDAFRQNKSLNNHNNIWKSAVGKKIIHTQLDRIDDMCFLQNGDKQLLVVANYDEGIFVYNTDADRLGLTMIEKTTRNE